MRDRRSAAEIAADRQASPAPGIKRELRWAAILSIGALLGHAVDAPDHLTEWWGFATFFVVVGAFQFFYGFGLLLQPWKYDDTGGLRAGAEQRGRSYYVLGLVLAIAVVVAYAITRTSGLPFLGPDAKAERLTLLSLIPVALDLPLIYCLAAAIHRTRQVGRP